MIPNFHKSHYLVFIVTSALFFGIGYLYKDRLFNTDREKLIKIVNKINNGCDDVHFFSNLQDIQLDISVINNLRNEKEHEKWSLIYTYLLDRLADKLPLAERDLKSATKKQHKYELNIIVTKIKETLKAHNKQFNMDSGADELAPL